MGSFWFGLSPLGKSFNLKSAEVTLPRQRVTYRRSQSRRRGSDPSVFCLDGLLSHDVFPFWCPSTSCPGDLYVQTTTPLNRRSTQWPCFMLGYRSVGVTTGRYDVRLRFSLQGRGTSQLSNCCVYKWHLPFMNCLRVCSNVSFMTSHLHHDSPLCD